MKRIISIILAIILLCALTSCGKKQVLSSDFDSETGSVTFSAVNARDSMVNGHVTLREGDCLLVSPMLERGCFQLRVCPQAEPDRAVLDEQVDGRVLSTYELEPGEYELFVSVKKTTTGTMLVTAYSKDQLQAENDALSEALDNAMGDFAPDTDGQNPVMNFIGPYTADNTSLFLETVGEEGASALITLVDGDRKSITWTMSGRLDPDTLTMEYSDCVKTITEFKPDGSVSSETAEYENGTGRLLFNGEDYTVTWEDDQEHAADGLVFSSVIQKN